MPKYIVERTMPQLSNLSARELAIVSSQSCRALRVLGPRIQWIGSHVTDGKLFGVYIAPEPGLIRDHGALGSFPIDSIRQIVATIDPTTAETYFP
ncbi:MAG TPA: DUF4242 domain-containing protein [Verrucomicrobiales bacterium]|nr:DUF4242 domain-containing protein [Verrucomicrobiales bacterium]